MATPPEFTEPRRSGRRVTVDVVAAAAKKVIARREEVAHTEMVGDFVSENPEWTHFYEDVYFADTIVDPSIQRPEQTAEINGIVADYDPRALGTITLWERVVAFTTDHADELPQTEWVVIDGQQRRRASLLVGYTGTVHANIHRNLTRKDAVRLFRRLNYRKSVSQVVLFKNALIEEDPKALEVQAILDGLQIPFGTHRGYSAAKGAVKLVSRKNGGTHFEWALRMIKKIYDQGGNGGVYDGPVVEAFFLLHERYGNRIDERDLLEKLASEADSTAGLVGFAKTLQRVHKGNMVPNIIRAIISRYNKGKQKTGRKYLPDWE